MMENWFDDEDVYPCPHERRFSDCEECIEHAYQDGLDAQEEKFWAGTAPEKWEHYEETHGNQTTA